MLKKLLVCYCIGFSVLIANAFDSYTDALIAGQEKIKAKNLTEAANAYFSFGETPRNNKMRNEAIEAYAKGVALETAPEDIRVLMQTRIDATYFELGKGDEAITEYKKTFTLTKTAPRYFHDVRIWYRLYSLPAAGIRRGHQAQPENNRSRKCICALSQ
jgi:tetratricopeptide (TPR) repeat protein